MIIVNSIIKPGFIFLIYLINFQGVFAQSFVVNDIALSRLPKESIILQTDRDLYISGEKIWFNADYFLNDKKTNQLSKVLYVELFNENDKPYVQRQFKIENANVSGSIAIPEGAGTGNYTLRAYTLYQKNFLPSSFYNLPLIVVNPDDPLDGYSLKNTDNIKIIPEGGSLIDGVESKVIVNLKSASLDQVDSLFVCDQNNEHLDTLNLLPNGLAWFSMLPELNHAYKLQIWLKNGDSISKPFPDVKPTGIITKAYFREDFINYQVVSSQEHEKPNRKFDLYIYDKNKNLKLTKPVILSNSEKLIQIPLENLEKGLNYLILKNEKESIVRINSVLKPILSTSNAINISTDKKKYKTREKVNLSISNGSSDLNNLTVSVVRKGTRSIYNTNIAPIALQNPHFLVNELHTKSFKSHHMLDQLEAAVAILDNELNSNEFIEAMHDYKNGKLKFEPEIKKMHLRGELRCSDTQKPVLNKYLYSTILFKNHDFYMTSTDKNGEFRFYLSDLYGKNEIFLTPEQYSNESDFDLLLKQNYSTQPPKNDKSPVYLKESGKLLLEELLVNKEITEKFANNENIIDANEKNVDYRFFGDDRASIFMKDYIDLETMDQIFVELLPSVKVVKSNDKYRFQIVKEFTNRTVLPGQPLVLIDNIPVFDAGKIMDMHPSQIKQIDVINRPYLLGENLIQGIIMLYTKKNNFGDLDFSSGSVFMEYEGLKPVETFSSIDFSNDGEVSIPNFKTVLYWNPNLKLVNDTTSLSFYTSDREGEYEILVKGYNEKGELTIEKEAIFVEKK